jgi:hypothetical protein
LGISLLSRYPIIRAETSYFYTNSTFSTTSAIYSKIIIGKNQYTVVVTKLNKNPIDQYSNIESILKLTHSLSYNNITNEKMYFSFD